jgi:hypothetical protein
MAINPEYEKPVQHQPNVAHDPLGQKSIVRGVPVVLHGKTVDDATGLPKSDEDLAKQEKRAREIQPAEGDQGKQPDPATDSSAASDTDTAGMPKYRCHKEVWALKIAAVLPDEWGVGLRFEDRGFYVRAFTNDQLQGKPKPEVGMYLVIYEDGYTSFSPAAAFEDGYTLVSPGGEEKTDANLDR